MKNITKEERYLQKSDYTILHFSRIAFRSLLILFLEIMKNKYGQKCGRTVFNVFTLIFTVFSFDDAWSGNILFLFILYATVLELSSFIFYKMPLNAQAFSALDYQYIIKDHPEMFIIGLCANLFVLLIVYIPIPKKTSPKTSYPQILYHLSLVLDYLFLLTLIKDFRLNMSPLMTNQKTNNLFQRLLQNVKYPAVIKSTKPILKNLILLQLESFENNDINKDTCPYLWNMSQQYEYIAPIESSPYTSWSTAGMLVTQCGFPQIMSNIKWNVRHADSIDVYHRLVCIPDYLTKLGYKKYYGITGSDAVQGFGAWRKAKNYSFLYNTHDDKTLAQKFADNLFPKIDSDYRRNKENFLTLICTAQTHAPMSVPSWCKPTNPNGKYYEKSYNCGDQAAKIIIQKFLDLKMYEHTVFAVFSDHIPFGGPIPRQKNKLFIIFPGLKKSEIYSDYISYYDFAPTVMSMIGIKEYSPGFPFGKNLFDPNGEYSYSSHPNTDDLEVLNHFLQKEIRNITVAKNITYICYDQITNRGFHSSKPCNHTTQLKIL